MLVLVTGGTGFIGCHSVAAMLRAGHQVRLFARDPARAAAALTPLAIRANSVAAKDAGAKDAGAVDVVTGDVTDPSAVARAVDGCDAVLHAASMYSFDTRDHAKLRAVNARGTETVLTAAHAAGADPIVHVSSFAALLPSRADRISPQSPIGAPRETYMASKAEAEAIARRLQDAGAPVVVTYPAATLGPHDPHLGDQTARIRNALRGLMPIWPRGGFPVGDVRDLAHLHAATLRSGLGPRRFMGPGRYVRTRDLVRTLRRVTGRALPSGYLPARAMLPVGALAGLAQRVTPAHIPAEYGAIYVCAVARPIDTAATTSLGVTARPLDVTVADTVRWLHAAGHLSPHLARKAAHSHDRDSRR